MSFKEKIQLRGIVQSVLHNLSYGLISFINIHSWLLYFLNLFFLDDVDPNLSASMVYKYGYLSLWKYKKTPNASITHCFPDISLSKVYGFLWLENHFMNEKSAFPKIWEFLLSFNNVSILRVLEWWNHTSSSQGSQKSQQGNILTVSIAATSALGHISCVCSVGS